MTPAHLRQPAPALTRNALRAITGRQHAVLTGRGAAGIWALLKAFDLRDRTILLPANTCYIVLWAVLKSGNRPLLVDIQPENISALQLPDVADEKPAAILPCHMYGLSAPMDNLCKWAASHNMYVIEDAALALGGQADGKPAGSWGEASVFSFGHSKVADNAVGGSVMTDDAALAREVERVLKDAPLWDDRLLELTNQWYGLYWPLHQYESRNPALLSLYPKLFEIYGDITVYQLPPDEWQEMPDILADLPDNLAHRERLAAIYDDAFQAAYTPKRPPGSILWRYPLMVEADLRDNLLSHLWENGLHDVTRWYPSLRYMTSALAPQTSQPSTPYADDFANRVINLRLDPGVDETDVRQVIKLVQSFLAEAK